MTDRILSKFAHQAVERLYHEDPELCEVLEQEYNRQTRTLSMVASCCPADPTSLACEGTFTSNVTAEGYPGARYHAGCKFVDQFEQLAIDRAKVAFKARYANVQPHSATTANQTVMTSLLNPGDTLLGMELDAGGHLTHGSRASISGQYFKAIGYGIDQEGKIEYDRIEELALEHKPKLIICGTTAYPRIIDFERFRTIADKAGAFLLADITHVAGLVVAGVHPSPIDFAHVTTTCTHKQLYGPRGGLILMGKDWQAPVPGRGVTLERLMQKGVFPFFQGAPIINKIVAKARVLSLVTTPEFKALAMRIVADSRALANSLISKGIRVIAGGSDTHIVLIDVLSSFGVTGIVAQKALEECGIIVNKNRIPGDTKGIFVTSGIRIGTNSVAVRGFGTEEMAKCSDLICEVLGSVTALDDREYTLDPAKRKFFQREVEALCARFPIVGYPLDGV